MTFALTTSTKRSRPNAVTDFHSNGISRSPMPILSTEKSIEEISTETHAQNKVLDKQKKKGRRRRWTARVKKSTLKRKLLDNTEKSVAPLKVPARKNIRTVFSGNSMLKLNKLLQSNVFPLTDGSSVQRTRDAQMLHLFLTSEQRLLGRTINCILVLSVND